MNQVINNQYGPYYIASRDAEETPSVHDFRVITRTTSAVTGKQIKLTHFEANTFAEASEFAKKLAVEKNCCVDVLARFDNGKLQTCGEYMGDAGELIIDAEDAEPEYDGE